MYLYKVCMYCSETRGIGSVALNSMPYNQNALYSLWRDEIEMKQSCSTEVGHIISLHRTPVLEKNIHTLFLSPFVVDKAAL